MRVSTFAAPGVDEPEAKQSSSEKLRCADTRSEMQVPGDARLPSTAWTRLPHSERTASRVASAMAGASLGSTKGILRLAEAVDAWTPSGYRTC